MAGDIYQYGRHRGLEPENSFPDIAWKLNNTEDIYDNELLVEVAVLNIDSDSFRQISAECGENIENIKKRIMDIVKDRGKLHNPVTGTGGILFGKVAKIGDKYTNTYGLSVEDEIISLSSLTLTPLKIDEILSIDTSRGQLYVRGKAVLFSHSPLIKKPDNLPIKLLLSVLDEAGATMQSYNLADRGSRVLIIGATDSMGLMCGYAVRKKLGKSGRLVGIAGPQKERVLDDHIEDIFDKTYFLDLYRPVESYERIKETEEPFDLVINCVSITGTEMFSVLCTEERGCIYPATLNNNYRTLCTSAEGIAKDINIIAYKGYSKGHAYFTINLLHENPRLIESLERIELDSYSGKPLKEKSAYPLSEEMGYLREISIEEYVFESSEIKRVLYNALKVANYDCTVLITGESGTGKEIFAKIIHKKSQREYRPLVKINCGSIPKDLMESELFGYEKGSFTGADKNGKAGFFETANGGTLFLDEIGELPMELQVKLLRAIQEKEIYRVGGTHPISVDVRIIAATNRNLPEQIREGRFREDLYYRLNVFPIEIPPLRERPKDIIPLLNYFLKTYSQKFKADKYFDESALRYFVEYSWPGNIRELENLVQRLLISVDGKIITVIDAANNIKTIENSNDHAAYKFKNITLQEMLDNKEKEILRAAKEEYRTTRSMAKALGLSQSTLVRKLSKYGI